MSPPVCFKTALIFIFFFFSVTIATLCSCVPVLYGHSYLSLLHFEVITISPWHMWHNVLCFNSMIFLSIHTLGLCAIHCKINSQILSSFAFWTAAVWLFLGILFLVTLDRKCNSRPKLSFYLSLAWSANESS